MAGFEQWVDELDKKLTGLLMGKKVHSYYYYTKRHLRTLEKKRQFLYNQMFYLILVLL